MSSPIARYSEDDSSTFNAALQSLEDLYTRIGNVLAPISSDALTSDASEIRITVPTGYRWLRFEVNTYTTKTSADQETVYLELNNDTSAVYAAVGQYDQAAPGTYRQTGITAWSQNAATAGGIAKFGTIRFMILPMSSEVVMFSSSFFRGTTSGGFNNLGSLRLFGRYTGSGTITSLRFYVGSGNKLISGTYWRLKGAVS